MFDDGMQPSNFISKTTKTQVNYQYPFSSQSHLSKKLYSVLVYFCSHICKEVSFKNFINYISKLLPFRTSLLTLQNYSLFLGYNKFSQIQLQKNNFLLCKIIHIKDDSLIHVYTAIYKSYLLNYYY